MLDLVSHLRNLLLIEAGPAHLREQRHRLPGVEDEDRASALTLDEPARERQHRLHRDRLAHGLPEPPL